MGVATQSQAEMADIARAVGGLRLATEHQLVDESGCWHRSSSPQHPIEQLRLRRLSPCKARSDDPGFDKQSAQLLNLLRVRRVVNTVHAGLSPRLQLLSGGDVRRDPKFLDQAMAIEAGHGNDRGRSLFGVEHHAVLADL